MRHETLRLGGVGMLLLATGAAIGLAAGGEAPAVPAAARPGMKQYQAAVTAADLEHARAVDKARAQLVTDLKAAQKTALQGNDVDGATVIAALAKQYATGGGAAGGGLSSPFAGTTWVRADKKTIRLNPDGSLACSDPKYTGTWAAIDNRQVVLFQSNGYVDVWRFDKEARTFKAAYFKPEGSYDGTFAK